MRDSGNPGVDRIELMQTFVRIVESGSLSAAAAQLATSQPTVSRRLQTLERLWGLRLLQRSTHVMKLTEDGERCYAHAKDLLDSWKSMEADLRGIQDEPEGKLRVLVPHAFGQDQLLAPLTDYLKRYPKVVVEWQLHDRRPDFIAEGVDCAIQVGEVDNLSLVAIRLFEVPRVVVVAPSLVAGQSITTIDDLPKMPWLAFSTYYREQVTLSRHSDGAERCFEIQPRMSTDSLYALKNAAIAGLGVAIVSSWLVAEDIQQHRLLHLMPDWSASPLPVYLVYPHARFYPARLRLFIETIRKTMPLTEGTGFKAIPLA